MPTSLKLNVPMSDKCMYCHPDRLFCCARLYDIASIWLMVHKACRHLTQGLPCFCTLQPFTGCGMDNFYLLTKAQVSPELYFCPDPESRISHYTAGYSATIVNIVFCCTVPVRGKCVAHCSSVTDRLAWHSKDGQMQGIPKDFKYFFCCVRRLHIPCFVQ